MFKRKYKIVLELDVSGNIANLERIALKFRQDILNVAFNINVGNEIKRFYIDIGNDPHRTTLVAHMWVKMSKREYIRFLLEIYQKYQDNNLNIS